MSPRKADALPLERESALLIVSPDPGRTVRRLATLRRLGEYELVPRGIERFRDTYLDTPDGELGTRHIALRIRDFAGHDKALTTLKAPGRKSGLQAARPELEVPLNETGARKVLAELQRLGIRAPLPSAHEFAKGDARTGDAGALLRPTQVRNNRRLLRDVRVGRRRVAELAIDRVLFRLDGEEVQFEEVEIEAKDRGTEGDVELLTRELLRQFRNELRPWRPSKLSMGKALEAWNRSGRLAARLTSRRTLNRAWLPQLARTAAKS